MLTLCSLCDVNYARLKTAESKLYLAQRVMIEQSKMVEAIRDRLSISSALNIKLENELKTLQETNK